MKKLLDDLNEKFEKYGEFYIPITILSAIYYIIFIDEALKYSNPIKVISWLLLSIPFSIFAGYATYVIFLYIIVYPLVFFILLPLYVIIKDIFSKDDKEQ